MTFNPGASAFRIRFSLENTGANFTGPFEIYASKNGGAYAAVTTSSTMGVKSASASSDGDNTALDVQRLTTP